MDIKEDNTQAMDIKEGTQSMDNEDTQCISKANVWRIGQGISLRAVFEDDVVHVRIELQVPGGSENLPPVDTVTSSFSDKKKPKNKHKKMNSRPTRNLSHHVLDGSDQHVLDGSDDMSDDYDVDITAVDKAEEVECSGTSRQGICKKKRCILPV
jgi:hypothetical protein